jgi:hypothetical protein
MRGCFRSRGSIMRRIIPILLYSPRECIEFDECVTARLSEARDRTQHIGRGGGGDAPGTELERVRDTQWSVCVRCPEAGLGLLVAEGAE